LRVASCCMAARPRPCSRRGAASRADRVRPRRGTDGLRRHRDDIRQTDPRLRAIARRSPGASLHGLVDLPSPVLVGDGSELDGYHGFAVTGRAGPIDDSLSAEVILPPPTPHGRTRRGLRGACFPAASWDGSDVFACGESSAITVTEAVKRALEEAKATSVAFQRLSEIERTWRADGSLIAG
jgi:hypothetical protein